MTAYQIFTAIMNAFSIIYGIVTVIMGTAFCTWLWINKGNLFTLFQMLQVSIAAVNNLNDAVKSGGEQKITITFTPTESNGGDDGKTT